MIFKIIKLTLLLFLIASTRITVGAADSSADAIAIRVIPNPNHYSALRWYKEQGFSGSPQAIIVDGYEAVRDGRTVYVNAANISDGNNLYTNIYLISYNQEAGQATMDIFGQILVHWKFNKDIITPGKCNKTADTHCLLDSDCPASEHCLSAKANIIRDVRRLADLTEIKIVLEKYKNEKGAYPRLSSGTYLPGKTISTWPSWQEIFASELNAGLPNDPINQLGDCPDYNKITCWNEQEKKFADSDPADSALNLPAGSSVYVYEAKDNGASYESCGIMESGYITELEEGACAGSQQGAQYSETSENHPPVFSGENLSNGESGKPYQGFVSASDADNDPLSWKFTIIDCPLWNKLQMMNTVFANQKAIKAENAGQTADCKFNIIVNDNREGGEINKDFTIKTVNKNLPKIEQISDKISAVGKNFAFTIKASEADRQYPLFYSFSGYPSGFNSSGGLDANKHDFNISGIVVDETKEYETTVIASDIYKGDSDPIIFKTIITNQPPNIISEPIKEAVACLNYNYNIEANDPDSHSLSYLDLEKSLPADLSLNENTGKISGIPKTTGVFPVKIDVRDQYYNQTNPKANAEKAQSYDLKVDNEVFSVTPPTNSDVWVFANGGAGLYYNPISGYPTMYEATVKTSTNNHITYKLSNSAHPVPSAFLALTSDFVIVINEDGKIQGTPTNNISDPGVYTVIITAANDCGASYSASFNITVKKNEWCGDGACHSAALSMENCAVCLADCACGSSQVCYNGLCCSPANCAAAPNWCSSHSDGCGKTINCGNCGPNAICDNGDCACASGNFSACDGNKRDSNGCECNLNIGVCQFGACTPYCVFDATAFDGCIIN